LAFHATHYRTLNHIVQFQLETTRSKWKKRRKPLSIPSRYTRGKNWKLSLLFFRSVSITISILCPKRRHAMSAQKLYDHNNPNAVQRRRWRELSSTLSPGHGFLCTTHAESSEKTVRFMNSKMKLFFSVATESLLYNVI
jgi:hypothetical protein